MSHENFKSSRAVWALIILISALTQTSAWSDEATVASVDPMAPSSTVDFQFPHPIPRGGPFEGPDRPTSFILPTQTAEADFFDSDKVRDQQVDQEREIERQRRLADHTDFNVAGSGAPRLSERPALPQVSQASSPAEIRPTLTITPGVSASPGRPARIYTAATTGVDHGKFHEPDCQDASYKVMIKTLVERDQKLILKQARHMEAIRRLRDEDGQHPNPELLVKLPPYESALRQRISQGIPKATIAKRKPKLDRWIYNGQAEEKSSEMQMASTQIKRRVKNQIESYGKFRQSLDKSQLAETSVKYLESYNAERAEVEHWIESFDRVCRSVTYLKKAQNRGVASASR